MGSSKDTDTAFPWPHCPTLQHALCLARGKCCAYMMGGRHGVSVSASCCCGEPDQSGRTMIALHPLPHVRVRASRHFLGQLFSRPLREHAACVEQRRRGWSQPQRDPAHLAWPCAPPAGWGPITPAACCCRTGTRRCRSLAPQAAPPGSTHLVTPVPARARWNTGVCDQSAQAQSCRRVPHKRASRRQHGTSGNRAGLV